MTGRRTATERWLAEAAGDRRRAYDARMRDQGLTRVSVMVPDDYVEWVRTFGRLLRNSEPEALDHYRRELEDYLASDWDAYDGDVASGRHTDESGTLRD